jgi:hypothetical protein
LKKSIRAMDAPHAVPKAPADPTMVGLTALLICEVHRQPQAPIA